MHCPSLCSKSGYGFRHPIVSEFSCLIVTYESIAARETETELVLGCYQINEAIASGRIPADQSTCIELGVLLAQIDWGDSTDIEVCC